MNVLYNKSADAVPFSDFMSIVTNEDVFVCTGNDQLTNQVTKNFLLIVPEGPIPLMLLTGQFLASSILFASG